MPLLQVRAPAAVRRIARVYVTAARRARRRLQAQGDEEALHDFRVALRRLRSTLRSYRPVVGARLVPRKWRRRLKRLARTTGIARDAEVGLAWLRLQRGHLTKAEQAVCDQLILDWTTRRDEAYTKVRRTLDKEFVSLEAALKQALAPPAGPLAAPPLAPTIGALMQKLLAALASELHGIASVSDTRRIHAARIEAKRLRYLLEPVIAEVANGRKLLKSLKQFQDEFGELCDRQVLSEELVAAAAHYEAERSAREMRSILGDSAAEPTEIPSMAIALHALARRLGAERDQRYTHIEQSYLGEHAEAFLAPYRALADTLTQSRTVPARYKKPVGIAD